MREEIKNFISNALPSATFDETGEWLNVLIDAKEWRSLAEKLKASMGMDYLFCLTCVDWKTHLTMVYHLTSTSHRELVVVLKCNLDRNDPRIETVSDIWRTAEFHEREVFEMFGVHFEGHPDLRRLILTDDFKGFPLRKDFDDPVNMIRL